MSGIFQSGSVTPGHVVTWVTDGVVHDGGALPAAARVIAMLGSANFNDTGDQPLILTPTMTAFMLTGIIVTNATLSLTTAVGGFYPQASKTGTAFVSAGQVYTSLTDPTKLLSCTLGGAVATTRYSRANIPDWVLYLSLTTPQGSPVTADCYAIGIDLS